MANRIYMENDIIICDAEGFQDFEVSKDSRERTTALARNLFTAGKPVLALIDSTYVTGQDSRSRQVTFEGLKSKEFPDYHLAIVVPQPVLRAVANLIILAAGQSRRTKLFSDRQTAFKWLNSSRVSLAR